jgi:RNA polymerase sigma-70 factor (ECF subfamily)
MATIRAYATLAATPRWLLHRRMGSGGSPTDVNENKSLADMVVAISERRDRRAFDALFKHYGPRLKAYFRRLGADSASAEDLMQDVMMTVWNRAHLYDRSRATVGTWLFTIARNRRIDGLRRERRPEFDPNDPALVPEPPPLIDQRLAEGLSERRLHRAFQDLPPEQADLIRKSFFDDKSHGDIAEEMQLPLGTVKSRLRLALVKLRLAMRNDA